MQHPLTVIIYGYENGRMTDSGIERIRRYASSYIQGIRADERGQKIVIEFDYAGGRES